MTAANEDVTVTNNKEESRYEIKIGDEVAMLLYREHGDNTITLLHTEVPQSLGGRGLGNKLAQFALEDARARNLKVIPSCPFVQAYIRRHPDYISGLTDSEKERFSQK